ncbi:MAG: hypothetical protein J0H74_13880 [Chitinophagaceae bacterium]|nr:hypothetical protein [Chitinophagaceae bacterium]
MKNIHLILFVSLTAIGCRKHKLPPTSPTTAACVVTSCPSYFGTTQTFTYDDSRRMTGRKYDFAIVGFGTFTQTVDKSKIYSSYTQNGTTLEETDVFLGGTDNLYDGTPAWMTRAEEQTSPGGSNNMSTGPDTLYYFQYDSKKRLTKVTYFAPVINTGDVHYIYARQLFNVVLAITYDDNDNAIRLKQSDIYRYGTYNANVPADSYFLYDSIARTVINVTYDSKPSPFTGSLKYWKFVQNDWGLATNRNWQAIITALSPHNPLTVKYELQQGSPSSTSYSMIYNYNDRGYPADSYTYDCR